MLISNPNTTRMEQFETCHELVHGHASIFERATVNDTIWAAAGWWAAMQKQPAMACHDTFRGRYQLLGQINT